MTPKLGQKNSMTPKSGQKISVTPLVMLWKIQFAKLCFGEFFAQLCLIMNFGMVGV